MANWVVYIEPGALDAWIENTDPSLSAQAEVLVWLAELESVGPPPIVDYSAGGLPIAEATEHAHIEFHVVSAPLGTGPPFGIVAIRQIL